MLSLKVKVAKAKALAKKRKRKLLEEEAEKTRELEKVMLMEEILNSIEPPQNGRDGRDAPTLEEILGEVKTLLPAPEIRYTEQKIDESELNDIVGHLLDKKLPEILPEDRPAVEQIIVREDPQDLSDYITKKDLDDALRRVQRAIEQSSGGGVRDLVNVIEVSQTTTIQNNQIDSNKINVVLVLTGAITITLPYPSVDKVVVVQQGYSGEATHTVERSDP